eukprot:scaffold427943_cov35-Prasinocladus_malaysianus.AAC.1
MVDSFDASINSCLLLSFEFPLCRLTPKYFLSLGRRRRRGGVGRGEPLGRGHDWGHRGGGGHARPHALHHRLPAGRRPLPPGEGPGKLWPPTCSFHRARLFSLSLMTYLSNLQITFTIYLPYLVHSVDRTRYPIFFDLA